MKKQDIFRLKHLALLCCIFSLFGGCVFQVHLRPYPAPYITAEKIDLSVGLFIDESKLIPYHSQSGLCLIGHTWQIQTGIALRTASEQTFRRLFTNVEILSQLSEFKNKPLTLLITPKIERFYVSQGLQAELFLYCKLVDQMGKVVYENTIPSKGSSQWGMAFFFGVWAGEEALSKTSTEAFNKAFAFLADDIVKKVDFSIYLQK